jgi:organic radical activating enzyme
MSGPKGERISHEECMAIIENLPDRIDRIILSGGEPWPTESCYTPFWIA